TSATLGTDIQQNFIGEFNLGNFKNKMVAGLDYYHQKAINSGTGYAGHGSVHIGGNIHECSAVAPARPQATGVARNHAPGAADPGVLSQAGADAGIALLPNPGSQLSESDQKVYSAYVSDVIYFMPELSAMASLRVDHFSN